MHPGTQTVFVKLVLPQHVAHLSDRPGNHASEPVGLGASHHGVGLAGSGLSVGHDGTIVAVQEPRDHAPRTLLVHLLLAGVVQHLRTDTHIQTGRHTVK